MHKEEVGLGERRERGAENLSNSFQTPELRFDLLLGLYECYSQKTGAHWGILIEANPLINS